MPGFRSAVWGCLVAFTIPVTAADPEPPTAITTRGRVELLAVEIHPRQAGTLTKIAVKEGQVVRKGQLLAELDDEMAVLVVEAYRNDLKRCELLVEQAKAKHDRLAKAGADKAELEAAERELEMANFERVKGRLSLSREELLLDFTRIRSPIGGRVERVLLSPGSVVQERDSPILRLFDPEHPVVVVTVGEEEYLKLRSVVTESGGQLTAAVGFYGEKDYPHALALRPTATFDEKTKTVTLRGTLESKKADLSQGEPVSVMLGITSGK